MTKYHHTVILATFIFALLFVLLGLYDLLVFSGSFGIVEDSIILKGLKFKNKLKMEDFTNGRQIVI